MRAVRQQQLFGTAVEDPSEALSIPDPVQSELIALLVQLMKSMIDAIEKEANDEHEQDHC